jgi:nucleoid DNA-binding protein
MTKKEIVRSIADSLGLSHKRTREIVQSTFDTVVETIIEEGRIELRNFGIFEVKKRAARKAHNPKTGEEVNVPAKCVVTFKPGKFMEERVAELVKKRK